MTAIGYPGVRLRVTFSFKDGKIQHVAGTPEGPEYAQYIAATKETMAWMAASRAEAWKKISDDKGALIRNGQTGPAVIMLVREYAQEQSNKSAIK